MHAQPMNDNEATAAQRIAFLENAAEKMRREADAVAAIRAALK